MKQNPRSAQIISYLLAGSLLITLALSCQRRPEDPPRSGSTIDADKFFVRPTAEHARQHETIDESHSIIVTLVPDGKLFLDRDPVAQATLGENLKSRLATGPPPLVFLSIDRFVKFSLVATVADIAFEAGAEGLFFIVERVDAKWPNVYGFECGRPVKRSEPGVCFLVTLEPGRNQSLEVSINDRGFASVSELVANLPEILKGAAPSDRHIFVKPGNEVSYRDVIDLLDGATDAGTESFALWTPKFSKVFPPARRIR